ncbi:MAG: FAD:protein FMN transferase, partial [Flavobacteriales bacterium]|nr:FAD:protein FMN transferase [Flavobacteriales bacterium]
VVTSGNYEKYVILDGKQYSHIIDPRTGYPCEGISSVTVFAPKAELADALSTAVFILGVETGLYLIDQLPSIDCIIVDSENKIHTSLQLEIEYEEKTK